MAKKRKKEDAGAVVIGYILAIVFFLLAFHYATEWISTWIDANIEIIIGIGIFIACIVILIIIASVSNKGAEQKAKELKEKQRKDKLFHDYVEFWNTNNIPILQNLAKQYDIVPLLYRMASVSGTFINQTVPDDVTSVLLYLDYPFCPSNYQSGYFSVLINSQEVYKISDFINFTTPVKIPVNTGDHVIVRHVGKEKETVSLNDFMVAWCKRNTGAGKQFNYLPLNYYYDKHQSDIIDAKASISKRIIINFSCINTAREMFGHSGKPRYSDLFEAEIPTGFTTLMSFYRSDTGSFALEKSGIMLKLTENDKEIDMFYDNYRELKFYKVTPGNVLRFTAIYEMEKDSLLGSLVFLLLPDEIPQKLSAKVSNYISKLKKQEDLEIQISDLKQKIKQRESESASLKGSEKRKSNRELAELETKLRNLEAQHGEDVSAEKDIGLSRNELTLKNEIKSFKSTALF